MLEYLIMVPARNEERIIARSLNLLVGFLTSQWDRRKSEWKLVVLDNGSTDNTRLEIENLMRGGARLDYCHMPQPGRGRAIRETVKKYSAKYYFYLDADIPTEPVEISAMLAPLERNEADITVGKRVGRRPWTRKILTFCLKIANYFIFNLGINDSQCGIKAFNHEAAAILKYECGETGWFLDTEFLVLAARKNLRIKQVPVRWIELRYPERKTKVRFFTDTMRAIGAMKRIASRVYPGLFLKIILFISLGSALFLGFWVNKIYVSRGDLYVAHHIVDSLERVKYFSAFLSVFTVGLWYFLKKGRNLPWRLMLVITVLFFTASSAAAVFSAPTRSQDIYHDLLLARGMSKYGMNPYDTIPYLLQYDPWSYVVLAWPDIPMIYGPLWTIFLTSLLGVGTPSLKLFDALVAVKSVIFIFLAISLLLFWKIMAMLKFPLELRGVILTFFAWNPFIIQAGLVDGHNDVIVLASVLFSYLAFMKKRHALSIASLILGGFVKYVPWILIPLPAWHLLKSSRDWRNGMIRLAFIGALGLTAALALYSPFSIGHGFLGILREMRERSDPLFFLPGTALAVNLFGFEPVRLRYYGLALALVVLAVSIYKKSPVLGYTLPFMVLFFFATPWFQPWYMLWIFPLLGLYINIGALTVLTIFLLLVPEVFSVFALSTVLILFILYARFVRIFNFRFGDLFLRRASEF